tara:strand:+ start:292 stop:1929 length:1638 start_codon:yes stop_codon:yes gene_type:complete
MNNNLHDSNDEIDLIIIGKFETIDYKNYSKLPIDRIDMYKDLVQTRMVYLDNGFHHFLDVFNKVKYNRYYEDSSYEQRRDMFNIWNLPSLNPALAATPLINNGFNCRIINNLDSDYDLFIELAETMKNPLIAISTTFLLTWTVIGKLIKKIRKKIPNAQFIIGGAFINDQVAIKDVNTLEKPMKKYGISYAIHSYNSEWDLSHLVSNLKTKDFSKVNNLAYFDGDIFCTTTAQWNSPYILEKDIPPWHKIDFPQKNKTIQLRSSSGCSFKCSFCTYPVSSKGFHPAEMDYLRAQLEIIKNMKHIENLIFIDDTPNFPVPRFKAMLNLLKEYDFRWYSFIRAQYIDDEIARMMKESGCDGVYLGIESSNNQILRYMKKAAKRDDYLRGVEYLKRNGITTFAAFIIGFPGETSETIQDNIDFIKQSGIDYYSLKEFWYAPNAPIAKKAKEFGLEGFGNNWKHNTMNSQEASEVKLEIFDSVDESVYLDSDSGLWYLTYLRDQNFNWSAIEKSQRIVVEMLRRDNRNEHLKKNDLISQVSNVFEAHNI